MSELKHTPGPWRRCSSPSPNDIESEQGKLIATIWGIEVTNEAAEANKALIITSPELLQALMEIIPLAERGRGHYPARAPKEQALIDNALRAIRWATQKPDAL